MGKDEEESWCRAKVVSINESMVKLFLIDFDEFINEKRENLQPLVSKFMSLPQMVFRVKLSRISPIGAGDKWAYDTNKKLVDLLIDPTLRETCIKVEGFEKEEHCLRIIGSMSLTYVNDDDPFGVTEESVINLAAFLIDEGLAFSSEVVEKISQLKIPEYADDSKKPKWKERLLPTKIEFKASVQWLDYDCTFYISVDEWEKDRQKLNTEINSLTFNMTECLASRDKHWKIGQAVLAKYSFDNLWYRGEIVQIMENHRFEVKLVDYGQNVEVPVEWISDQLLGLDIDQLVMPVKLDILPLTTSWEKETLDVIHAMVDGQSYKVKVMGYGGIYPLYVDMKIVTDDGVGASLEEILIDNKLVKKGHRERMRL